MADPIRVNEVFGPTIQGEGVSTGRHCLFVRVSRCNLHCTWCLGPNTEVSLFDGGRKKIKDIQVGDKLLGWDEERGVLAATEVTNTKVHDAEEVWVLRTSKGDQRTVATPEHRWMTTDGWKRTDELEIGDVILHFDDGGLGTLGHDDTEVLEVGPASGKQLARVYGSASPEEKSVYDLTCSPHPTFVANGMVSHNCDTPYTWAHTDAKAELHEDGIKYDRSEEEFEWTPEIVLDKLMDLWDVRAMPTTIVISGGEPMLQQKQLAPLVQQLLEMGNRIEVETAGVVMPREEWTKKRHVQFNVSPKLEFSGNSLKSRRKIDVLNRLADETYSSFKFVISHPEHMDEVKEIVKQAFIPREKVWIMPEGMDTESILEHGRAIVDDVMKQGWNLTLRNHTFLWGKARGK